MIKVNRENCAAASRKKLVQHASETTVMLKTFIRHAFFGVEYKIIIFPLKNDKIIFSFKNACIMTVLIFTVYVTYEQL